MLTVENLTAGYGRSNILHDVGLVVRKGTLVCIVGGNGAGKTTTMRAIAGMLPVTAGRVHFNGADIAGMPAHKVAALGLTHVPEGRRVFASLSVLDNLRLGAFRRGRRGSLNLEADLDEVFTLFPRLRDRSRQMAGTLSGGEQQMLSIGRALMAKPELILLDEPSMGLAPKLVEEVYRIVVRLREQGRTILLVEQFANLALGIADYGYVLENGRFVISGTGRELLKNERVREAYIGAS